MIEIYRSDLQEKLEQIEESQYMAEDFNPKDCWINLINPSDKEVSFISSLTGLEDDALKYALDDEERARLEKEENHVMVLVDIPILEESNNYFAYSTIPMSTFLHNDFVVTICLKETAILRDFIRNRIKNFATFKKSRFLFQLLNNIATKYLAYLKQIDKASQRIKNELNKSTRNKELIQMLELENSLVYFSTSLTGNDAVITKLLNQKGIIKMYEEDKNLLEDVAIDTKQAIEMCSIYRDILSSTTDAYAAVIGNNLNIVMKILTSVTLIISIPTLIASLWGMNTGVPMEGKPLGFWLVLSMSLFLTIGMTWYLRKKKLL